MRSLNRFVNFKFLIFTTILLTIFTVSFFPFSRSHSATIEELQQKIEERNQILKQLDQEINDYQNQLGETSAKAKNLENKLREINLTIKSLTAELKKTQTNILNTNDSISALDRSIAIKESSISDKKNALNRLIKTRFESESISTLSNLLSSKTLGEVWGYYNESNVIQDAIKVKVDQIKDEKTALEFNKASRQAEKNKLMSYKSTLDDQKKLIEQTQQEQNSILKRTKNSEASFKKELDSRLALKEAFEQEIRQYESDLKLIIDPSSVPTVGSSVLSWPLDSVKITQLFGDTDFARQHMQAYNGKGHNGIDLGAKIGTPVKAAASGKITATGNTDYACRGASYGNWILIEHPNGISTLYAHLSLIKVSAGQNVNVGEIIGYSGNTGYTTGPHLHFTVYATQGVRIISKPSKSCGSVYTLPVADFKAYINPMLYLPSLP